MTDKFLGLAQFLKLEGLKSEMGVKETVESMIEVFQPMGDQLPSRLVYDPKAGWLIGLKFQPLPYINLSTLFQDQDSKYGLFLALDSVEAAGPFKGISSEVRYEKRKDSAGRFTGSIGLPDAQRVIQMGAVKIIVPEVSFDLYRNGDFKVDVGFPVGLDFSRSLCIEAPPYVGWGGFYLARLSSAAYSRVPTIDSSICGHFESILEAGLAVKLGYGKSIDRGILQAGVSLTGIGILEGTVATFRTKVSESEDDGKKFNWYKGVLGLSGKVYGKVDLEVLTAKVDCEVNTTAEVIVESYRPTNIALDFDVDAQGEIEVDFGLTKGKISKSFHENMKMDLEMGKKETAPWEQCGLASPHLLASLADDHLVWQPVLVPQNARPELTMRFIPHLSVGEEAGNKMVQCAAMMYMDAPIPGTTEGPFKEWVKGMLLWTLNAYLNRHTNGGTDIDVLLAQTVTGEQLKIIQSLLTTNGSKSPIDYNDNGAGTGMAKFLASYFSLLVCHPEADGCSGTSDRKPFVFFPMLPDFKLTVEELLNGGTTHITEYDYTEYNKRSGSALQDIKDNMYQMMTEHRTEAQRKYEEAHMPPASYRSEELSMATYWTQDNATVCIQTAMMVASDKIGDSALTVRELLEQVLLPDQLNIMAAMISRFPLFGLRVKPREGKQTSIYRDIGQQFAVQPNELTGLRLKLERRQGSLLPVKMNACSVPPGNPDILTVDFPDCELRRMNDLQQVTLPDDEWQCIRPLHPFVSVPRTYPSKRPTNWRMESVSRTLNVFSEVLGQRLTAPDDGSLKLCLKEGTGHRVLRPDEYRLATFMEIRLRPTRDSNLYELIGVNSNGRAVLEQLARALNTPNHSPSLESVHMLHFNNGEWKSGNKTAMIFRNNVTTFTEPVSNLTRDISHQDPAMFAQLLHQSGTVRSGGFFLWYDKDGFNDWPQEDGETIRAQVLFRYSQGAIPAAYVNAADTVFTPGETEGLFFLDSTQSIRVPAFPPGHAGLEIYRPHPGADDQTGTYLRRMFHLIGAKVVKNEAFDLEVSTDVPIAPIKEIQTLPCEFDSSEWEGSWFLYNSVLPVAKQAKRQTLSSNGCEPANNPYAGIGDTMQLQLYLQDVFGNVLANPKKRYDLPVLYRDFIIPAHQWPGTTLRYQLVQSTLTVCITFEPEVLTEDQRIAAKDSYACAFHLLSQADVQALLSLSIEESKIHDVKSDLLDYVRECWCKLDHGEAVKKELILTGIKLTTLRPLFELTVDLSIVRTDSSLIDPELQYIPEASRGESRILHESIIALPAPMNAPQTLEAFAADFEAEYGCKLAKGAWLEGDNGNRLWVVAIGENGCLTIERQATTYLYASPALETAKRKRSLDVQPYESCGETDGSAVTTDTTLVEQEVDLDSWAQESFAFIDDMLQPPYLPLIGKTDGGVKLERILQAKKNIATAFVNRVNHMGSLKPDSPGYPDLETARERFKQQMLVRLSDAYDQDTIVQQPFHVNATCGETDNIGLYGSINAETIYGETDEGVGKETQATFSPAKLSLQNGNNNLTYLFNAKNADGFTLYRIKSAVFQVTHVEYTPKDSEFTSSAWISLIIPHTITLGDLAISVALKSHPEPPSLTQHGWSGPANLTNLGEVRKWEYTYAYRPGHDMADQDRVKHEIHWNEEPVNMAVTREDDLPKALAQFRYMMLDIRAALHPTADPEDIAVAKAINCLTIGMERLASAWDTWATRQLVRQPMESKTTFDVYERKWEQVGAPPSLELVLESVAGPIPASAIWMTISDYITEQITGQDRTVFRFYREEKDTNGDIVRKYLAFEDRMLSERMIRIKEIDIFSYRRAWTGLYKTRNERLLVGCDSYDQSTAEMFVYRTQKVKSQDPTTPLLRSEACIDFSDLSGADETQIEEHIDALLKKLFEVGGVPSAIRPHSLVCSATYRYAYISVLTQSADDAKQDAELSIPVCLKHAFIYSERERSIKEFCRQLNELLIRNDGPPDNQGRFVIRLIAYPDNPEATEVLPLITLERLELPLNKIKRVNDPQV